MKLSTGRTLISAAVIAGNILLATGAIPVHASTQSAHSGAAGQVGAQVIHSLYNEVSPSLLSMAGGRAAAKATSTVPNLKTTTRAASTTAASGGNTFSPVPGTTAIPPVPSLSFEGMGDALPRTSNPNDTPPDANGAVGPHNYVETVNLQFAVFDRVGTLLFPTTTIASLWSKSAHPCNPDSDPIVAYDQLADRWVISSMAYLTSYQMCVAVSTTGDPLGSWNLYTFPTPNFPDYQKLAVWSDGYYFTDNDYPNTGGVFGVVGAFDRTAMLAGQPATMQRFALDPAYVSPLPAVLTGSTPPPAGSPGYFSNLGSDNASLNLWRLHVNWGNPAASTLSSPTVLPVAPFTLFCDCVLDPGDTTQTEGLGDRLMYPLTYRNFGDHESLYATHTVDTSGGAGTSSGMRWYELRNPNGAAQVYQQNTFNPDSSYRWMGSVASDQRGDIALGDSLASSQISTSVTYTGRLAGDPLDVMSQGEEVAVAGNGSLHVDPATGQRWGDYSSMAIDPTDNCTFWYTQEYFDDGTHQLNTRVTAFKFPSCSLGQSSVSLSAAGNPATDPVTLTASVSASGTPTGTVTFQDGATILGTAAVVGGSASLTTTIASGARSLSASYSGNSTVSGSSSALLGEAVTATPPGTPTNAAAYPGNGQATVTFGPPASNGGSSLTGYVVTSSPGGLTAMVGANVTSATVTGLLNGTSYTFNVKASNSSGSGPASAPSNPVSPAGGGGTISNLQVGDTTNAANWSVQQNLQVGNLAYKDRTYTLSTIPSSLLGSQWIQPAMASKTSTANPLVTFTVSSSMQICVAVDVRLGRRPWMDPSWIDTGSQIVDSESTTTHYQIFCKTFPAGQVTLGPNVGSGSSYAQYLVIGGAGGAATVPGAPTSVMATAGNGQATVSWTAPTSNGGASITTYKVTSAPGGLTTSVGGGVTSANVSGLTDGTTYTFTVAASNSAGTGPISQPSSPVTPATLPSAPGGVSATAIFDGEATVSWTTPASSGGAAVTGYLITPFSQGAAGTPTTAPGTGLSTIITGLSYGTGYTFRVAALNSIGIGPASAASSAVTPVAPVYEAAPTNVSATAGDASVTLTWTAPPPLTGLPLLGFNTDSPQVGAFTAGPAATSLTITGLTNGQQYQFTVSAFDKFGAGPDSAQTPPVTPEPPGTPPGAPTKMTATPGNASAYVNFNPPTSDGGSTITSYTLASGGQTWAVDPNGNFPFQATGLTNGNSYTFTVTATNANGTGPASAASNAVTPLSTITVPGAPTNVVATSGNTTATVTWTAPSSGGNPIVSYSVSDGSTTVGMGPSQTSYTFMGLSNGTTYTFTVVATNDVGDGPTSTPSNSVIPAGPPGAPTNVVATPGNSQATLTWTAPSNNGAAITSYSVNCSGIAKSFSGSPAVLTGLTNGTTYSCTVNATNGAGTGPASSPVTVTPSGGGGILSNPVSPCTPSGWSVQQNLQVGNVPWFDRTYTMASIPSNLLGSQWIRDPMACKTATNNPLVTLNVSASMTIYVAVDIRRGRPAWIDSTWADTATQIIDNESTPTHLEVFSKTFAAGSVALGPNVGSGSTYVQYLVIAK